jgi:hypothetical protein
VRCASCGHEVPAGQRFCEACGRPLEANGAPMRSYRTIWAALAFVLYAVLADLVVETFLSGSPLRWEIAVPVIGYLALCLAAWRFAPVWWRRLDWAHRAGISLIVLIGGLGVTAWLPGGVTEGVRLLGGQTGTVFAMVSALAVALAGALLGGNRSLPTVARAVGALLAAYGIAGFVLGAVAGTPYPLFSTVPANGAASRTGSRAPRSGACSWSRSRFL